MNRTSPQVSLRTAGLLGLLAAAVLAFAYNAGEAVGAAAYHAGFVLG